jgi:signal transduction histidine kinase
MKPDSERDHSTASDVGAIPDYHQPFSPLLTGMMYLSADGRIHQLSEGAAALMRVEAASDHIGKPPFTGGVWAGTDIDPEFWCARSCTSGETRMVTAFYRRTGSIARFECTVTPLQLGTQGMHSRVAFREVTAEVQRQCWVFWHSRVLEMIAGRVEINEILKATAEAARATFEADAAVIKVNYVDANTSVRPLHRSERDSTQGGRDNSFSPFGSLGGVPVATQSWKKEVYELGESDRQCIAELELRAVRFHFEDEAIPRTLVHLAAVALSNHRQDIRLMMLREAERKILGIQLHNDPMQRLSALHNLVGIEDSSRLHDEIDACTDSLRSLSFAYYPALESHGLAAAVKKLAEDLARSSGWRTMCEISHAKASADVETVVFRTVQEALYNVEKHAKATEVTVQIKQVGDKIMTVIEDNGIGLEGSAQYGKQSSGYQIGIAGSRHSIEQLGGRFQITAGSKSGTRVFFEVPAQASLDLRLR